MAKRPSKLEQLQHENAEIRSAARQLLAGLTEYAKDSNWSTVPKEEPGSLPDIVWIGKGKGPDVARYFLGLVQAEEQN